MFSKPKSVTGTPVALMVFCHKVGAIDFLTWFLAPTGPQNWSEHLETKSFVNYTLLSRVIAKTSFSFLCTFSPKKMKMMFLQ